MFTPFETFEQIKEGLCSYLETAYRIANPSLFEERGELIRSIDIGGEPRVAQDAFVESTPRFAASRMLADFLEDRPEWPRALVDLAAQGTTVGRLPLYDHQTEALGSFLDGLNLVLATGTGSGKTEAFILPILGDILRQAAAWPNVTGNPQHGRWDAVTQSWQHGRRHERRPAAVRALILYPMNALVNDQAQRLRRILAKPAADSWQENNLRGNRIYFGMYTGDSEVPGHWLQESKRNRLNRYLRQIRDTWAALGADNQNRGYWPNPNSSEMLIRWDMQAAPPDILVTNYSMLEYMLVRPIEGHIFEATRRWLETEPGAIFTLVVDEAHTYVGARGTEISYLIRRLKERLQLNPDDARFRCIATSASLPTDATSRDRVAEFASALFAVTPDSLAIIDGRTAAAAAPYQATPEDERRFSEYFERLRDSNALDHREHAAAILLDDNASAESRIDGVRLYDALRDNAFINAIRQRTARNATQLDQLRQDLFGGVGGNDRQMMAIGGALAAGAIAKINDEPDALNLLSTRIHMLFRGVPGIWACMDRHCTQVDERFRIHASRPVGKLFIYQRPWCDCGARVLELFTCRVCGLAFLGGIADANGGLWPWTDDLEGGKADYSDYSIFGVERPSDQGHVQVEYRSTRTTRIVDNTDRFARETFAVTPRPVRGVPNPFPSTCPRCSTRRSTVNPDSQVIEPLRTRGSKAFSVLVDEAYRTQPDGDATTANRGRKALTFADSRQDAAMLASDLEVDHNRDVLRQVFYYLLVHCGRCHGSGETRFSAELTGGEEMSLPCDACDGTGQRRNALPVEELREATLTLLNEHRINPTFDDVPIYFTQLLPEFNPNRVEAERHIDTAIRDEIAARDIGLEPIGLASWHAAFEGNSLTPFQPLTQAESVDLIDNVVRLLAAENVLLPPTLDTQYWRDLVDRWEQQLVLPPNAQHGPQRVVFSLTARTRLGRYMNAVGRCLVEDGRLINEAHVTRWLDDLTMPLYRTLLSDLRLLNPDLRRQGTGLNINRFRLIPMPAECVVCTACAYIMRVALLDVCLRCGQRTEPAEELRRNYYRRNAEIALQRPPFPDPFSLRVKEHTAQIEKPEARRTELKFQDVFIGGTDPDDERVDILSVTTTMEMGIDIGALSAVGLRNIPPTVANYQQRAGRAGRRGNAVATVVAFAQQRSHDQYYFADPPRIVSDPPRVPSIQVDNEVIAQRHIRALVLQRFFAQWPPTTGQQNVGGLLNAWGNVRTFWTNNGLDAFRAFIGIHREALARRAERVVADGLRERVGTWIGAVADDVSGALHGRANDEDILGVLLDRALLPRHAFPIDVVALYTDRQGTANERERGIQRDLGIALSEFAPGAELVRDKRIYTIAGLYEPFTIGQQFRPTEKFVECRVCHAIQQVRFTEPDPARCNVCRGNDLWVMPLIRPHGFCSDWAIAGGARSYRGGGRDRVGTTTPAQLAVGQYCYTSNDSIRPRAFPQLLARLSFQPLYIVNRGEANQPGFEICSTCGRSLPQNAAAHTVPADLPPRFGPNRGALAGTPCRGNAPRRIRSILGHDFPTEVMQIGVELTPSCQADMREPVGRALWASFGTTLRNAAARHLQVGSEELRVGVRPSPDNNGRLTGEVFIYDSLPGGAGHARSIMQDLDPILTAAEHDSDHCYNEQCIDACYSCMMSYDNQPLHPILGRTLASAMLAAARGTVPAPLAPDVQLQLLQHTIPFALDDWRTETNVSIDGHLAPVAFYDGAGHTFVPLLRPALLAEGGECAPFIAAGCISAAYTDFDAIRRPYWLVQQLASLV